MSKWITDRLPAPSDATIFDCAKVWVMVGSHVRLIPYHHVDKGQAWQPIEIPHPYMEPYVAPKSKPTSKCSVWHEPFDFDKKYEWYVLCNGTRLADNIPTREAAERIAAIYNEVIA